ncbi:MAG: ATP F0F1 synthase subunit B [Rhodospirillaceae bacterium]|jgi:F-type H+-transporting ATPase subunit b|nr:ATP F0F1 synthase subunit B [Rhodospirillaceae bacterium]MBT4689558.1 ATP F0F1 synthase subunit B [Rhodospirillaceae bacterium]MBT5080409.1 ATP F0F1 synthase subunit B [Rhodospirillaceae bacterium]MBT5523262.1 ATP F0F1 synthase subunit B [Rhodospirillaceae bacterium]MBT5878179.1 ATP F0F1 synthase subunit B [Rhodospirillaceae bacterium]
MDATFWVGAAFLLFIGILFYFKVPAMLTGALDKRSKKIADDLDQARQLREEAQALLANYERKQRDALSEAEEIIAHAREEALREAAIAAKKLDETIARRQQSALDKIAMAEAQAEKEVRDAAVEIAVNAATSVVAQHVSGDRADALIATATADLGRHLN